MSLMTDDEMLTVREVALRFRCHPMTIRRAIAEGSLRGVQLVPRGRVLLSRREVDAFLAVDDVD